MFSLWSVCVLVALASFVNGACEINPHTQDPSPLILNRGGSAFLYPVYGDATLKFAANWRLDFVCPSGRVVVAGAQTTSAVAQASCVSGSTFLINNARVTWAQISCSTNPVSTARYTGQNCVEGGKEAEIGFNVGDGRFVQAMRICFDPVTQNVIYSQYDLTATILQGKTGTPRPSFDQGSGFFSVGSATVDNLYTRATQRRTINAQLGLAASNTKYIHASNNYFLSRGHLTARSDFFYPSQQNATFSFINAAPQWQTFNGFNWDVAETDVQRYAGVNGVDLKVWTGTYGIATLPHETTGQQTPLYLYSANNNKGIPVPELYWKVVYNPITKRGIGLVGLNNPYQLNVTSSILCDDRSDYVTWLNWRKTDIQRGYSYACTVTALRRLVRTIPDLDVRACEINPHTQDPSPLILNRGGSAFLYPVYGDATLKFAANWRLDFVCPSGRVVVAGAQTTSAVAQASCVSGSTFLINNARVTWAQISCSTNPVSTARYTGQNCVEGGKEAEIGFNVGDGRFVQAMRICFDPVTQNVIYSQYDLTATILQGKTGTPRPSFDQASGFFSVGSATVDNLYTRATQRRTINAQLGLAASNTKYIHASNNYFLSRGHLTARSDFFYPSQQNATFSFINAAPQWQTFNGFNWDVAETDVQRYAGVNGVDLKVWTGTYGIATLPHETTGQQTPLYLYSANNNKGIPVPELYWKVVYNPITKRGIGLVGLNNPYQLNVTSSILCDDRSDYVTWLNWRKTDIQRGYSYACTVTALRRLVRTIPDLDVRGLLF